MRLAEDVYAVLFCTLVKNEYVQAAEFGGSGGDKKDDGEVRESHEKVRFANNLIKSKTP